MSKYTQEQISKMAAGITKFAYLPIKTHDDVWVWLKEYIEVYSTGIDHYGELFIWSGSPDSFQPLFKRYQSIEDVTISKLKG